MKYLLVLFFAICMKFMQFALMAHSLMSQKINVVLFQAIHISIEFSNLTLLEAKTRLVLS
jgi:hypothetical protein